jgi:signal transduction histidine kinase
VTSPRLPARPRSLRASLFFRLSLVLFGLFLLLAVVAALITRHFALSYQQEVAQRINREVAVYIAKELDATGQDPFDARSLEELFKYVMIVNPTVEVYLLDAAGNVRALAGDPAALRARTVDLAPIRAFVHGSEALPLVAVNPRTAGNVVFSAAPIGPREQPTGYVYAVLRGAAVEAAMMESGGSYRMTLALASFLACLVFLLVTGLLLFRTLTGRLQRFADRVDRFHASGFAPVPEAGPHEVERGDDEIARIGEAFDAMAVKINAQFAQLQSIDRGRREAILNASHDLRTPLAALQGYLQTLQLKAEVLTPAQREHYLDVAQRHAQRMSALVEQMFALAKLDAPETAPRFETFSLAELAGDVAQKFRLRAAERRLTLRAEIDPAVPPIRADIGMVERLAENLVDNALKFTPAGGDVRVQVGFAADAPARDVVLFAVADSGRGIAPDELPRVFDRFYRVDRADGGAATAGSGLGLAIVKRIADLHDAEIRVDSRPGAGARFVVRFGAVTAAPHAVPARS